MNRLDWKGRLRERSLACWLLHDGHLRVLCQLDEFCRVDEGPEECGISTKILVSQTVRCNRAHFIILSSR